MRFHITVTEPDEETGGRHVQISGDPDFFFFLLNAAGAAQSGVVGNQAEDSDGNTLVLMPEQIADAQPREPRSPQRLDVQSDAPPRPAEDELAAQAGRAAGAGA